MQVAAPARSLEDVALMAPGYLPGAVEPDWLSFGEYLDHLAGKPLGAGDLVLVKGSRGVGLEAAVDTLCELFPDAAEGREERG